LRKPIFVVLILVCMIVFSISAGKLISYYSADRAAEEEFAQFLPDEIGGTDVGKDVSGEKFVYDYLLPYYKELRNQNSDMVGWLRIPGTRISYPVMQTRDAPEYYLRRDFNKDHSMNGSLFADAKCDVNLPADVVTIYGHRMKSGAMFGSLGDYLKPEIFEKNDKVIFDTFTSRNEYKIYCVFSVDISAAGGCDYYNYAQFEDEEAFDWFIKQAHLLSHAENPMYMPTYGDKLLLLSTCEYTHKDGRLVVVAVKD